MREALQTEHTLLEAILSPFSEIAAMESEISRLQQAMAEPGAAVGDLTRRLGDVQHRFEAAGGFRVEAEAKIILGGLGFEAADHARPLAEFSGGYRMRALLGSLLLRRPDYLLLDEPTNHLDLEGIGWLESYLARIPSAIVLVSHDRFFLNRLAGSVAQLDRGRLRVFRGDYDHYRAEKALARERAAAAVTREDRREAEVRRFIDRFRYKATKARQVQERIRMLEKADRTEAPHAEPEWGFRFPRAPRSPRVVLDLQEVVKAYGPNLVLDGVNLTVERGDKVALVGPNGCGKSTLLKVASGQIAADGGEVIVGEGIVTRHFAQHVVETLTPGRTVVEEMQDLAPARRMGELRSLLGIFQFSGDDVFKRVEILSGGEKNRLALARLMVDPGNFLVLDEPTNHLDLTAREALEEALAAYEGAVLFVSHDRYFINRVARKVAGFESGSLRVVEGGYDAYLEAVARSAASRSGGGEEDSGARRRVAGAAPPSAKEQRRQDRRAAAEARNERNRRLKGLRESVASLEEEIARRERRLHEIASALARAETYNTSGLAESLGREQKALSAELASLIERWESESAGLQQEKG